MQHKLFFLVLFFPVVLFAEQKHFKYSIAKVIAPNGNLIQVEVADTPEKRTQGLGFRENLPTGKGMLFVFAKKERYGFWMKNMKIPIDIIWLDNHQVVDVLSHVAPPQNQQQSLQSYYPKFKANFVLEVAAGDAKRFGFQEGSTVRYQF